MGQNLQQRHHHHQRRHRGQLPKIVDHLIGCRDREIVGRGLESVDRSHAAGEPKRIEADIRSDIGDHAFAAEQSALNEHVLKEPEAVELPESENGVEIDRGVIDQSRTAERAHANLTDVAFAIDTPQYPADERRVEVQVGQFS
jgi:hypothetical protein